MKDIRYIVARDPESKIANAQWVVAYFLTGKHTPEHVWWAASASKSAYWDRIEIRTMSRAEYRALFVD